MNQNDSIPNFKRKTIIQGYKYVEKIKFNFLNYLLYLLCNKKNKILIYEDFRRKIISEEQIIQSYIKMFKLLNAFDNNNNEIKKYGNLGMTLIMNNANKSNI